MKVSAQAGDDPHTHHADGSVRAWRVEVGGRVQIVRVSRKSAEIIRRSAEELREALARLAER